MVWTFRAAGASYKIAENLCIRVIILETFLMTCSCYQFTLIWLISFNEWMFRGLYLLLQPNLYHDKQNLISQLSWWEDVSVFCIIVFSFCVNTRTYHGYSGILFTYRSFLFVYKDIFMVRSTKYQILEVMQEWSSKLPQFYLGFTKAVCNYLLFVYREGLVGCLVWNVIAVTAAWIKGEGMIEGFSCLYCKMLASVLSWIYRPCMSRCNDLVPSYHIFHRRLPRRLFVMVSTSLPCHEVLHYG